MHIKFDKKIYQLACQQINYKPQKPLAIDILVSMGVDSVAMMHYCMRNRRKLFGEVFNSMTPLRFIHFDHNLRKQNDEMAEKFIEFNKTFNNVSNIINLNCGSGTEDSCRKARIEYLTKKSAGIHITAHHLDDCVESYMLNVLRGKEGFLPIPFYSMFGGSIVCHPFLFTEKKAFREYCVKNDLMRYVVEDETNVITKGSRRNLIRNEIIPILDREKMGLKTIVKKKIQQRLMLEIMSEAEVYG